MLIVVIRSTAFSVSPGDFSDRPQPCVVPSNDEAVYLPTLAERANRLHGHIYDRWYVLLIVSCAIIETDACEEVRCIRRSLSVIEDLRGLITTTRAYVESVRLLTKVNPNTFHC
jgi:hypothetical protein